jgi:hypothetical protein
MAVNDPHFDLPFTFGSGGHARVVGQGTLKDVQNCVEAAVRTPLGMRYYVPNFGISDPIFGVPPTALSRLDQEIKTSEPRAVTSYTQYTPGEDPLVESIVVGVSGG